MIAWGPELHVGWDEIDSQHKEIMVRVADLHDRVEQGDEFGAQVALGALSDIVVLHFATEQDLMERSGYPERSAHRGAHELFLQDLQALAAELDEEGITDDVNDWVRVRMTEWISFHIRTNDLPLGRHLARLRHRSGTVPAAQKSQHS
ncbi:MAG TPA: hemerythrin domain-containing protein [Anaeromyxobacteraceae bacterium]|nr:hemerythrin domain-containing protein [Anaeromyxobacteraceae bacterium]